MALIGCGMNIMYRCLILLAIVVAVFVVVGIGFAWTWRPAIDPISAGGIPKADRRTVQVGAELATIGNCNDCHMTRSGRPFAGGRALPTSFGTIFSSNITPDPDTGIGAWSEAAFRRAMRDGVDREGRHLYPAFPYDHFTKATDEDIQAIYLFLMSQSPVRNSVPENQLAFPFNFRPVVAGWKLFFLREAPLRTDSGRSAEWNRGRYLVEGLGHCGACHTPRNVLGAEKLGSAYTGGSAEGWYAPSLDSGRGWTADQLAEYLSTGWHRSHGAAAGPMADVTRNLGFASTQDVLAIAEYIASLRGHPESVSDAMSPKLGNRSAETSFEGAAIYAGACATCHDGRYDVGPSKAISLSHSSALRQPGSANAVRVILRGIEPGPGNGGPYMPAFEDLLTDAQIAALADYLRARYVDGPPWTDTSREISKARQEGS
jgi:mono/diheme cytochrome c family protein